MLPTTPLGTYPQITLWQAYKGQGEFLLDIPIPRSKSDLEF
jgi:hypothetical protein